MTDPKPPRESQPSVEEIKARLAKAIGTWIESGEKKPRHYGRKKTYKKDKRLL